MVMKKALISGGIILFIFFWLFKQTSQSVPYRQSIVVMTEDSAKIFSWSAHLEKLIILDIPSDVTIVASRGYGKYTIRSLMALDRLEHKNGSLLVSSLSDTTGIPISWYSVSSEKEYRSIFSWSSIWAVLTRQLEGSVPLGTWVSFVISVQSMSADTISRITTDGAYMDAELADGSVVRVVDPNRFDYMVGNAFLDTSLRGEGIAIAIYNTTPIPFIGQRAARMMGRLGLQLVSVGNSEPEVKTCTITGEPKMVTSKTAQFIRDYFLCVVNEEKISEINSVADLVVRLGTDFAAR